MLKKLSEQPSPLRRRLTLSLVTREALNSWPEEASSKKSHCGKEWFWRVEKLPATGTTNPVEPGTLSCGFSGFGHYLCQWPSARTCRNGSPA